MGKLDLLAVRADEEEGIVTHEDILSGLGGRGSQKKDADAFKYVQEGYRQVPISLPPLGGGGHNYCRQRGFSPMNAPKRGADHTDTSARRRFHGFPVGSSAARLSGSDRWLNLPPSANGSAVAARLA